MKKSLTCHKGVHLAVCTAVAIAIVMAAVIGGVDYSAPDVPTYAISADYAIDISNPNQVVGEGDYVFVGRVNKKTGTTYKNLVPIEKEDGKTVYVGDAYTNYTVTVLANIKNSLVTTKPIKFSKLGGVRKDGSAVDIIAGDTLPVENHTYIFIANTQTDGTLLVSGANSNILVTKKSMALSALKNTSLYKKYVKATKNQMKIDSDKLNCSYNLAEKK